MMREQQYSELMDYIFARINDGVVLMTDREEYNYKKQIVKRISRDLSYWLKQFPFMHILK